MARCVMLVGAMAILAACGSSAAAPSSPVLAGGARCGPAAGRTLVASSGARVYELGGLVYACAPGGSRRYRLGDATRCLSSARVGPAAAAGGVVAYAVVRCETDTSTAKVVVQRVSDGRVLFGHPALSAPTGPEALQSVGSIVVSRGGAVAWIATSDSIVTHRRQAQVIEASGSRVRVLDNRAAIGVRSLRLHGTKLTWRVGGAQRSARLR